MDEKCGKDKVRIGQYALEIPKNIPLDPPSKGENFATLCVASWR
jgi:hypothetical protein